MGFTMLFTLLVILGPVLSFADMGEYLKSNAGQEAVSEITRAPETLNTVTLLHLGKNSKPARLQMIRDAKEFMFMTIPYWFNDDEGVVMKQAVQAKRDELGDTLDFRIIEDWSSPMSTFDPFQTKITKDLRRLTNNQLLIWNGWSSLRRFSPSFLDSRLHDKYFVVDGKKMIMGGLNIGNVYQQGGVTREGWHDTDILLEGPVVQQATHNFMKMWHLGRYLESDKFFPPWKKEEVKTLNDYFFSGITDFTFQVVDNNGKGPFLRTEKVSIPLKTDLAQSRYFPSFSEEERESFKTPVRLIYNNPLIGRDEKSLKYESRIMKLIEHLIDKEVEMGGSVLIFDAYPTFTRRFVEFLASRAKKIPITLVTNSHDSHDLGPVVYNGQLFNYERLLKGGVRIIEWQGHKQLMALEKANGCVIPEGSWPGQTMHTKAMVFDQSAVLIGSHNFNTRSDKDNSEIVALVDDAALARQMLDIYRYDLDLVAPRLIPCGDKMLERPVRVKEITPVVFKEIWTKYSKWAKIFGRLQRFM